MWKVTRDNFQWFLVNIFSFLSFYVICLFFTFLIFDLFFTVPTLDFYSVLILLLLLTLFLNFNFLQMVNNVLIVLPDIEVHWQSANITTYTQRGKNRSNKRIRWKLNHRDSYNCCALWIIWRIRCLLRALHTLFLLLLLLLFELLLLRPISLLLTSLMCFVFKPQNIANRKAAKSRAW